jgi:cytochrome c oxidase assembly protein subunit 11
MTQQTPETGTSDAKSRGNRRIAVVCAGFIAGMVGMAYAAVPLYDMFCRVTGYGGTTQRVEQYSQVILDRDISIRFDANTAGGLPWDFKPVDRNVTIKLGETTQVSYTATNTFSKPVAGRASFNVTPQLAGAYFMKVECFCFTDTVLQPGETMDMPVVFYVDPEILTVPELKNIKTITLSYTFFPLDRGASQTSAVAPGQKTTNTDADTKFGG